MEYYFLPQLFIILTFSDSDFDLIFKNAQRHYDAKVVSLTEIGGFLYGEKNSREFANNPKCSYPDKSSEYSFQKLDIISKALEIDCSKESLNLQNKIRLIINSVNNKYEEIIPVFKKNIMLV